MMKRCLYRAALSQTGVKVAVLRIGRGATFVNYHDVRCVPATREHVFETHTSGIRSLCSFAVHAPYPPHLMANYLLGVLNILAPLDAHVIRVRRDPLSERVGSIDCLKRYQKEEDNTPPEKFYANHRPALCHSIGTRADKDGIGHDENSHWEEPVEIIEDHVAEKALSVLLPFLEKCKRIAKEEEEVTPNKVL